MWGFYHAVIWISFNPWRHIVICSGSINCIYWFSFNDWRWMVCVQHVRSGMWKRIRTITKSLWNGTTSVKTSWVLNGVPGSRSVRTPTVSLRGFTGMYGVLRSFTVSDGVLRSVTVCDGVLRCFTESDVNLSNFKFTGFDQLILGLLPFGKAWEYTP